MRFKRARALALLGMLVLAGCGGGGGGDGAGAASDTYGVPAPVIFPARANDVVWDERRQVLYLSLPSGAGPEGNAIVALDPRTNTVVRSQFAGSEPTTLSLSDDGEYLYAALDGRASVQRFRLPALTPDLEVSLGADPVGGPLHAVDLAAVPGSPRSFVVARSPYSLLDQVSSTLIFDDDIARPRALGLECLCASLQWGDGPTQLFAVDNESTAFSFHRLQVDADGLQLLSRNDGAIGAFRARVHYSRDKRLLYSDDGAVIDPATGRQVAYTGVRGVMVPDTARGRLYATSAVGSTLIGAYDATTFQPIGLPRPVPAPDGLPSRLVRWGGDGLALTTGAGPVVLYGGAGTSNFRTAVPVGGTQQTLVPGAVNRIAWVPQHGRLYASMSGASPSHPHAVVAIDPATAQVTGARVLGGEPYALAASDDGRYLYVGLAARGTVQRLRLPGLEADLEFAIGGDPFYGAYYAGNIAVAPGRPGTVAVARFSAAISPPEQGGLVVYDEGVARPATAPTLDIVAGAFRFYNDIAWNNDGTRLYAGEFPFGALHVLGVDAAGLRFERSHLGAWPVPGRLQFDRHDQRLYHDSGRVTDPATGRPLGLARPAGYNGAAYLARDGAANRVFVLSGSMAFSGPNYRIEAYDAARYTPLATYPVTVPTGLPQRLLQWGPGGLAFIAPDGVYLLALSPP